MKSGAAPTDGVRILEGELGSSHEHLPELVAAFKYAAVDAVKWAVAVAFIGCALLFGNFILLMSVIRHNDIPPAIGIPMAVAYTLLSLYIYLLMIWTAIRLLGKFRLSKFNALQTFELPGNGWIAIDNERIYVWEYRTWWPSLKLRGGFLRDTCAWEINNIRTKKGGCIAELSPKEVGRVEIGARPQVDVEIVGEWLRSDTYLTNPDP